MNATLSKSKNLVTLSNGATYAINEGETVADFMNRVRTEAQAATGETITITKAGATPAAETAEAENQVWVSDETLKAMADAPTTPAVPPMTELEKFRKQLLAAAMGNKPKAKTPAPEMTPEQREAFEANELSLKALREAQAAEKARLAAEAKAAREAEKARLAAELKAQREAELEASRATRQADVDVMIAEANQIAQQMMDEGIEALQAKISKFVNEMVEKATHYLNTGTLPGSAPRTATTNAGEPRTRAPRTTDGDGVEPNPDEVAHIRSLVGSPVSLVRSGETVFGTIVGCGIDRRMGLATFKIKGSDDRIYYKSYAKMDDLTIG